MIYGGRKQIADLCIEYGWLMNTQEQKVCRSKNDMPMQHAQFVEVETGSLIGSGQLVIRRMLRHNAIEA